MRKGLLLRLQILQFSGDKTGFLQPLPAGVIVLLIPKRQSLFLTKFFKRTRCGIKRLLRRRRAFPKFHRAAVKVQDLRPEPRVLQPQRLVLGMDVNKKGRYLLKIPYRNRLIPRKTAGPAALGNNTPKDKRISLHGNVLFLKDFPERSVHAELSLNNAVLPVGANHTGIGLGA